MTRDSYWLASAPLPRLAALDRDLEVDVAIVGAGMTGLTAAYLLTHEGQRVAVLERDRCAAGDTGATSAHLTCVTDPRIKRLARLLGNDHARAVWDAGLAAIDWIEATVRREKIDASFHRVPGYLVESLKAKKGREREALEEEAHVARQLGFDAQFMENVPLFDRPGMIVANQAVFHPLKYLRGLLEKMESQGTHVFEHSEVTEFSDQPLSVKANGHVVKCRRIVIATHVPLMGNNGLISATLFQAKLAPYSSYVVGARVKRGVIPHASFWDTTDPYYYLRVDPRRGFDYAILGGEDHKTGQVTSTGAIYRRLEKLLAQIVPGAKVDHRWSGQVIQTNDGLPFIGELGEGQFAATGFVGNGITFGTLAGMMACDWVRGRRNPWSQLFATTRRQLRGSTWDYVRENLDYPYYLARDWLKKAQAKGAHGVRRGEAKILDLDGQRVAAYRDEHGKLKIVSAVCTHLGCVIHWNQAEKTWDCPCHGSRFTTDGKVIAGPAETPLRTISEPRP